MEKRELNFIMVRCPDCGKILATKKKAYETNCPCCELAITFIDEVEEKKKPEKKFKLPSIF